MTDGMVLGHGSTLTETPSHSFWLGADAVDRRSRFAMATGDKDFVVGDAGDRRFWPVGEDPCGCDCPAGMAGNGGPHHQICAMNRSPVDRSPVFVTGPQGCGKTRNAAALAKRFGCERIVDEWTGEDFLPLLPGDLVLTNLTGAPLMAAIKRCCGVAYCVRLYQFDQLVQTQNPHTPSGDFSIGGDLWPGLSKLIEEAGETAELLPEVLLQKTLGRVQQVAGKLIGSEGRTDQWSGDIGKRLVEELGDLKAAIDFFMEANSRSIDQSAVATRHGVKLVTFRRWHREGVERRHPLVEMSQAELEAWGLA